MKKISWFSSEVLNSAKWINIIWSEKYSILHNINYSTFKELIKTLSKKLIFIQLSCKNRNNTC